jgi:hypothetical protein
VDDPAERPTIVCLCGSSRLKDAFEQAAEVEALAGRIVLSLGIFSRAAGVQLSAAQLELQHRLHRHRIDLADEVLVVNPAGYVGESTQDEVDYARGQGKAVRWLHVQLSDAPG